MSKNIFVRATALSNVSGRVAYISSEDAQESLVAFYSTQPNPAFWSALAAQSQRQRLYNPDEPACEARELIIAIPNVLSRSGRYELCRTMVEDFHRTYGVDCCAAIHNNPGNYHMHLIFAERTLLPETEVSIATRNTYFNAAGKRATKKECTDEAGELLPQCRLVKKGENLSEKQFSSKDESFGRKWWLAAEKERLATFLNDYVGRVGLEAETLTVYKEDKSVELPMTRLVRGEPGAVRAEKLALNADRKEYNEMVHEAIEAGAMTVSKAIEQKNAVLEKLDVPHEEQPSTARVVELLRTMRNTVVAAIERVRGLLTEKLKSFGIEALIANATARAGTNAGRVDPARGKDGPELE